MKRILAGLLCLLLASPASAQVAMTGAGKGAPGGGGGGCGGWTPATPAGLIGWYKADVGVTGTSPVTAWADQSGNGNNMSIPTGWTGPVYNATGLGGQPSIDFPSSAYTYELSTTVDTTVIGTGSASSVFGLASFTGSSTNFVAVAGNGQSGSPAISANSYAVSLTGSGPSISASWNFNSSDGIQTAPINSASRFGFIYNGSNGTSYVNNTASSPTTRSFSFTTPGTLDVGINFWGTVRELMYYTTALGSTDRGCLDAYLLTRQGAGSLTFGIDGTNYVGMYSTTTMPLVCPSTACNVSGSSSTLYGIGTASTNRVVGVVFDYSGAGSGANAVITGVMFNGTVSGASCTGGTAATQAADSAFVAGLNGSGAIWYAALPTGTTASVCFTAVGGNGWGGNAVVTVFYLNDSLGAGHITVASQQTASPPSYYTLANCSGGHCINSWTSSVVPAGGIGIGAGTGTTSGVSAWSGTASPTKAAEADNGALAGAVAYWTTSGTVTEDVSTFSVAGWMGVIFAP